MLQIGVWLIILGILSFVYPLFGFQLKILSVFGEAAPLIGAAMAILGIVLVIVAARKNRKHPAFEALLGNMSGDEMMAVVNDMEKIKPAVPELRERAKEIRSREQLTQVADEFAARLGTSRNAILVVLRETKKVPFFS